MGTRAWFTVITEKINAMKEIEDQLSGEILSTAGSLAGEAKRALAVSIVVTLVL